MPDRPRLTAAAEVANIAAAVFALVTFALLIQSSERRWWVVAVVFACVAACVAASIVSIMLYREHKRTLEHEEGVRFGIHVREKTMTYRFLDARRMQYTKRLLLRATRSGVDRYPERYAWTGTGRESIRVSEPHYRIENHSRGGVWKHFDVCFGRTLAEGEEVEFEVTWDLEDSGGTAVPFLGTSIAEPIDILRLKVIFPDSLLPANPVFYEKETNAARVPLRSEALKLDRGGNSLEKEILNPRLYRYYMISWAFASTAGRETP